MKKFKCYIRELMENKVELALNSNEDQERSAIESPYIFGYWFYEPVKPVKEVKGK